MPSIKKKMEKAKGTKEGPKSKSTLGTEKTLKHFMSHKHGDFLNTPINQLNPDPNQPRKEFDKIKLKELSESIKNNGILEPILIRYTDGKFWIVAGERRYRAAKIACLKNVPCIVTTGNPGEISLIENIQRDNLKPFELTKALRAMMEKHNYNQTQLGNILGKSRKTISEILIIDRMSEEAKKELSGVPDISRRVMVEIAREPDPKKAVEAAKKAKLGVKSPQLRKQRQTQAVPNRNSDSILLEKINKFDKALEHIEDKAKISLTKEVRAKLVNLNKRINKLLKY